MFAVSRVVCCLPYFIIKHVSLSSICVAHPPASLSFNKVCFVFQNGNFLNSAWNFTQNIFDIHPFLMEKIRIWGNAVQSWGWASLSFPIEICCLIYYKPRTCLSLSSTLQMMMKTFLDEKHEEQENMIA